MNTKVKLVLIDAARVILYANVDPLPSKEIVSTAIEERLINPDGKTPERSMAAMLYTHIKNQGSNSLFENVSGEEFTLTTKGKRDIARLKKHIAKFTPVLYVVSNEAMPEYIKIGISTQAGLPARIQSLSGTNVPLPFNLIYVFAYKNARKKEDLLKKLYEKERVTNKEFYDKSILSDDNLHRLLVEMEGKEIDINEFSKEGPSKIKKADNTPEIKPKPEGQASTFTFEMLGIPVGSELNFIKHPEIKCVVTDNNKGINYEGAPSSLSGSARKIRKDLGFGDYRVQGGSYWEYQGEKITDIRNRLFNESPLKIIVSNRATKPKSSSKTPRFTFEMVKVPIGETLTFVKDTSITCIVADNTNVNYQGRLMLLTTAAKEAGKTIGIQWNTVRGSDQWKYKGEVLTKRRKSMGL